MLSFLKCFQGRKQAMKMLKSMLQERRANPRKNQSDFFDYVIEELQKEGTILTEAIALDLMFVLLFASFETTSLAITFAVKLLSDNPQVLKQLTVCEEVSEYIFYAYYSEFLHLMCSNQYDLLRKNMMQFWTVEETLILDLHGGTINQWHIRFRSVRDFNFLPNETFNKLLLLLTMKSQFQFAVY